MAVNNVASANPVSVATATANSSAGSLDYSAFLKLLVAQVEFQDPLKPVDSTEYVAQLATFAQVEQSIEMNNNLGALLISTQFGQAAALVGKTIETADGGVRGTVESVRMEGFQIIAVLESGDEVVVGPGITIKQGEANE